jgi:hypothetical protein
MEAKVRIKNLKKFVKQLGDDLQMLDQKRLLFIHLSLDEIVVEVSDDDGSNKGTRHLKLC